MKFWHPALQLHPGECGLFTMIWKEMVSKNLNLESIKFYTCALVGPLCKIQN